MKAKGSSAEEILHARRELAVAYVEAGDYNSALDLFKQNADDAEYKLPLEDIGTAEAHGDVAYAFTLIDQDSTAEGALFRALQNSEMRRGQDAMPTRLLRRQLALLYLYFGDAVEAIKLLKLEATISTKRSGEASADAARDRELIDLVRSLSEALHGQNTNEQARDQAWRKISREMVSWLPEARWLGGLVRSDADKLVVARITAEVDRPDAPDRLDIDPDARALAALVASRAMQPPLAIGVYGHWGSGKSFLLRRIEHWITALEKSSQPGADAVFERGIVHVKFSAWHYADGNLWASLLSEIFRTLDQTPSQKQKTVQAAIEKVKGAERIRAEVSDRLKEAKSNAEDARKEVDKAKAAYQEAIEEAAKLRAQDVLAAIRIDSQEAKDLNTAFEAMGLGNAANSARDLLTRANEAVELATRTKLLATAGGGWMKWRSPLGLSVICFLAVAAVVIGITWATGWADWKSPSAAAVAQFTAVCSAVAAWIGRQSNLARKLLDPAEAVQRQVNARVEEERAKSEKKIVKAESRASAAALQVTAFSEQLASAQADVNNAKQEQESLTPQVLLKRYLSERAGSGDYERHQGLVALAHRDLKNLSDYLTDAKKVRDDPSAALRRIVLYIDDLDRCPPSVVARVLDAVHLLLALPLFIVIVGVDPRWLEKSLTQTHRDLFGQETSTATPTDYLEKIFQLTYNLPALTRDSCQKLLSGALSDAMGAAGPPVVQGAPAQDPGDDDRSDESRRRVGGGLPAAAVERAIEALTLTDEEAAAVEEVASLVACTPRRAKRFLSTYLVVRTSAFTELDGQHSIVDSHGLLVMVALMVGTPSAISALTDEKLAHGDPTIVEWVGRLGARGSVDDTDLPRLNEFAKNAESLGNTRLSAICKWRGTALPYIAMPDTGEPVAARQTPVSS